MNFFVRRDDQSTGGDAVFEADKNLLTGEKPFTKEFGNTTSLESDLLLLASSIFAADRATARGEGEDYPRTIQVSVPIVNMARLQLLSRRVERILRKLSNDAWRIELRQEDGKQERVLEVKPKDGKTLLFSGGLDSMAAAVDFGGSAGSGLHLVSHIYTSSAN